VHQLLHVFVAVPRQFLLTDQLYQRHFSSDISLIQCVTMETEIFHKWNAGFYAGPNYCQ